MSDCARDVGGSGAARRRRDRRLRMHWRHEQLSLRMLPASVGHHGWQSQASVGVQTAQAPVAEHVVPAPLAEYTSAVHAAPAPVITDLASLLEPPVPDVPVFQVSQVPRMLRIEKVVVTPAFLSGQGTHTSESVGTAPVRRVIFSETVEMVEFQPPLPAESVPPLRVTTPVVEALLNVVEHVRLAPVVEFVAPAAPAPVAESVPPAPVVTFSAPTPVVDCMRRLLWSIALLLRQP